MAPSFVFRPRERPLATLTLDAPAKINLYLRVTGRRPDGYHALDSLFHTVGLYDRLTLSDDPARAGGAESIGGGPESMAGEAAPIAFTCSDPSLAGDDNLAVRAARSMIERAGGGRRVRIHLEKHIPAGAGLGGGSSDAAAVLAGLNRLWHLGLTPVECGELGAEIGSDVPFFLHGGAARVTGRGEMVTPVDPLTGRWCVLVFPGVRVSTAEVFRRFAAEKAGKMLTQGADASIITSARNGTSADRPAAGNGPRDALGSTPGDGPGDELGNDLQETACGMEREITLALDALRAAGGAGARMSGSGASVFCLAPSQEAAEGIRDRLKPAAAWSVWVLPLVGPK